MLTAMHMDSTYTSPSSARLPGDSHLLDDLVSVPASPPAATVPPHPRAVPACRRIAKRPPRPSRRPPTTYICANPANFRRIVHQVTGADDLPAPVLPQPELLHPAPARAASAGAGDLLLPTLDTSAFLLGRAETPARSEAAAVQSCDGSAASAALTSPVPEVEVDGQGGAYSNTTSDCGFPTLESWDLL